jgi:hypothetical protein
MAFNLEKGREILNQTIIGDLKHRDYKKVTELAAEYTKMVTGEDIGTLLKRFVPRENEEAFKQREALSQLTTPDICNSISIPMYKIGRSHANYSLNWKDSTDEEKKRNELNEILNHFYGDESVDSYLTTRLVELDATDPNSFIVVEYKEEVNPADKTTKANPYPFEVNSTEAVNYKYINNELQFLIVWLQFVELDSKDKEVTLNKYTQYLENEAIVAKQIQKENLSSFRAKNPNIEIFATSTDEKSSDYYSIEIFEHKAGRIPARRVGTRRDKTTRWRTCVPMMHPAYTYLKKSIKTVSEFDLTNCLHVFQKLVQYDEVCPGNVQAKITCSHGKQADGKTDCPECEGTGWKNHKSSSDIIRVRLPKDPKDLAPLNNYMAYFAPQMELLEFQKKLGLYELKELAIKAVYASDIFISDTVAATATEKNIDLDAVYDTLKSFADSWSAMRTHITYCTASIRDMGDKLEVVHKFPNDFKMETLDMLLEYLSKINTSGAPSFIKKGIIKKISEKIFRDEPFKLLAQDVKERFFPFNGKTTDEINNILLNDLTTMYNMVLYANFETIFQELEDENNIGEVNFYKLNPIDQKSKLKAKVDALVVEIQAASTAKRANSFNPALG